MTGRVLFLVRHHLDMSAIAQKQDLSDPAVVDRFAALVGNERQLIALYILTVADIRGRESEGVERMEGQIAGRSLQCHAPASGRCSEHIFRGYSSQTGGGAPIAQVVRAQRWR